MKQRKQPSPPIETRKASEISPEVLAHLNSLKDTRKPQLPNAGSSAHQESAAPAELHDTQAPVPQLMHEQEKEQKPGGRRNTTSNAQQHILSGKGWKSREFNTHPALPRQQDMKSPSRENVVMHVIDPETERILKLTLNSVSLYVLIAYEKDKRTEALRPSDITGIILTIKQLNQNELEEITSLQKAAINSTAVALWRPVSPIIKGHVGQGLGFGGFFTPDEHGILFGDLTVSDRNLNVADLKLPPESSL